jgi:hypothetical protein
MPSTLEEPSSLTSICQGIPVILPGGWGLGTAIKKTANKNATKAVTTKSRFISH